MIILTRLEVMLDHVSIKAPSSECRSDTGLVFGVSRKTHTIGRRESIFSFHFFPLTTRFTAFLLRHA